MWNAEGGMRTHHAEEGRSRVISIGKTRPVEVLPVGAALLATLTAALLAALTATLLSTLRTVTLVTLLALRLVIAGALFGALSALLLLVALPLLIVGVPVRILVVHICSSRESAEGSRMQSPIQNTKLTDNSRCPTLSRHAPAVSVLGIQVFTRDFRGKPRRARARGDGRRMVRRRSQRTRGMRTNGLVRRIYNSDDDDGPALQEAIAGAA